jgi:hypothetical protein
MKTTLKQSRIAVALAGGLAAGLLCAPNAQAQSEESDPAPALAEFEAALLPPPEKPFLVPDVPQSFADHTQIKERWGAPELVARFSHEDLNDGAVQGGRFDKTYLGINWWATRRWKVGFGWGHTWLDRFDKTGVMDIFLTRLQWVY